MISIQHNMAAWNAGRQLKLNTGKKAKTTEKLSSGYRINRAADDAAGLAISEKMRRQIRGLHQSVENIEEGVGYVQTAEGALNEVDEMLQRMNELMVKGANGTLQQEDREYIDREVQALKKEIDRVFSTTSFNNRMIWEADPESRVQIGTEEVQAVTFKSTSNAFDITDENCGVMPVGSFAIQATEADGVSVTWTGYDGNVYTTDAVDWDTLKANDYTFEMSDYFGGAAKYPTLYKADGTPQFTHEIAFSVAETATVDDIITCIDKRTVWSSSYAGFRPQFEDAAGNAVSYTGISFPSYSLSYAAAYVSSLEAADGHTFDGEDDAYLEPSSRTCNLTSIPSANTTSVETAKNSGDTWSFTFDMAGIGTVRATSYSVDYASPSSTANEDENLWWRWEYDYYKKPYKSYINRTISGGTLGNVMDALTGDRSAGTPGILTADHGGVSDHGGRVDINFRMTSDNAYSYGTGSASTNVGYFSIRVSVSSDDTEQSVLDKINAALNDSTVLDFYTMSKTQDSNAISTASAASHKIEVPVWGGTVRFWVQAGTESDQQIELTYDSLRCLRLGLGNTKADTPENCKKGIAAVKSAMQTVNGQRAEFGAYQNRLEHAANSNRNVAENTQAAESRIRDTDMAEETVRDSAYQILLQAGQTMLAQANQQAQHVLALLQ